MSAEDSVQEARLEQWECVQCGAELILGDSREQLWHCPNARAGEEDFLEHFAASRRYGTKPPVWVRKQATDRCRYRDLLLGTGTGPWPGGALGLLRYWYARSLADNPHQGDCGDQNCRSCHLGRFLRHAEAELEKIAGG